MSQLQIYQLNWQGREITLRFYPNRWNGPCDHIEIESENREPLPITETGYKSHFIPSGTVCSEKVETAVIEWLDRAAQSADWKEREAKTRQMSLF
ncbi:hypothetical protein [Ponticaulis sp.]|uniref:hypothetical protein n=1 Tax=Ponticaulis sp. TaxID=2020902 RepID=UPI000C37955C|nr:hypothetical protein [Ponticaulis sp.]HBH90000.1 hypothetical protein [Hyphomonadaceae bacterium]MAJ07338.1 hypothetical protein [Ponticaulis sp.]MAJ07385.1 hypothetical protein [Ponticaulis sp.]MAP95622.1 hypothetical protein [Ponticaulis sp.]HBJ92858.1 hypothetical protein [Hyphomonadaceae bacterium]|tara:strand:+ start:4698 stop:4982 length:285 start_codon:yes stop_codon:yes gene_type:complete